MFYIHQIIFSLLCISHITLSIEHTAQSRDPNKPIKITPLYAPEIPEDVREGINNAILKQQIEAKKQAELAKKMNSFSAEDIEEMELIFESSPQKAQIIVNHLEDPTYFPDSGNYRSSFFVGDPGTGKTIMAKAIAYKLLKKGWDYKFVSSTSFLGEHRNQTAIHLQTELETIAASNTPTILIIDELHRLLENADSKHHDTDSTSTALWTFLDKQKGNTNFFLIGTMNRTNKLPKPFKDRMFFGYIAFPLINDSKIKNDILRKSLTTTRSHLDAEVTNEFLNKELERMGPCSGRNLKKMSTEILRTNRTSDEKTPFVIRKTSITQTVNEYIFQKKDMQYDVIDETDEERQNRYHNENITLQKNHQKQNLEAQERHFVQQQIMQPAVIAYQKMVDKNGLYSSEAIIEKHKLESLISDEQKQLFDNMMINTRARQDREAAIKAAAEKIAAEEAAIENAKWFWQRL